MEPIISFSFTELICRYALVKRGPRKYGTLQDILTSGAGVSCAVGMRCIHFQPSFQEFGSVEKVGLCVKHGLKVH